MSEEIKIRMRFNEETGEKEIFISYEGEGDSTPIEHERRHRAVVEELLGKGILNPDDLGKVKVGRTTPIKEGQPWTQKKKKISAGGEGSGGDGGGRKKTSA